MVLGSVASALYLVDAYRTSYHTLLSYVVTSKTGEIAVESFTCLLLYKDYPCMQGAVWPTYFEQFQELLFFCSHMEGIRLDEPGWRLEVVLDCGDRASLRVFIECAHVYVGALCI